MNSEKLIIQRKPKLYNPRLVMGFSGWMDGGDISTGTVKYLIGKFEAEKFGYIDPEGFYIYNFPGSKEISTLVRPHVRIQNGLIQNYMPPQNNFYCAEEENLILFIGKEPNMAWGQYADCIFNICNIYDVSWIYYVGSVAGLTPHTREPRIFCSVSNEKLRTPLREHGIRLNNYEGPASIVTYFLLRCAQKNLKMLSLVAEIPAYVQGYNPRCIETTVRCVAGLLGLHVQLDDIRAAGDEFEKKVTDIAQQQEELSETITKLEEAYDEEVFDTEMYDMKKWLENQGIRVD